jgi:hypothetical protein
MQLKAGQDIQVDTTNPKWGWGLVSNLEIGTVRSIDVLQGRIYVNFPSQSSWSGTISEFRVMEDGSVTAVCKKAFPGVKVGDKFNMGEKPAEFFDEEYFDFIPTISTPNVQICGYEVEFEKNLIKWGCRRFSVKEVKTILEAIKILEEKELEFRLGYDSKHTKVTVSDLNHILEYHEFVFKK